MTTKEKNKISNFPNQSARPLSPYLALHVCHDAKIQQFPRRKIPLSKGILGRLAKQALVLVVKLFVEEVEVEGQAVGVPKAVRRGGTEVLVCTTLPPSWIRAISQGWIQSFWIWTKISSFCLEFEMSTNGFGQLIKKKILHFVLARLHPANPIERQKSLVSSFLIFGPVHVCVPEQTKPWSRQ